MGVEQSGETKRTGKSGQPLTRSASRAMLYRLRANDLSFSSFVLGTAHIRAASVFKHIADIEKALFECGLFAAEYDLDALEKAGIHEEFLAPEGKRMQDLLRPAQFARLERMLRKTTGIELSRWSHLTPLALLQMMDQALSPEDEPLSLDAHLWKRAGEWGLERTGLETVEAQMRVMQRFSMADQLQALRHTLRTISTHRQRFRHMLTVYETGDPQRILKNTRGGLGKMRKWILYDRNYTFAERIDELARQRPTFAAIGAAHLAGGKGVLRLLKQKGWEVKREG